MSQLFEIKDGSIGLDHFRTNTGLAETCRAAGQRQKAVEFRCRLDHGEVDLIVLRERRIQLALESRAQRCPGFASFFELANELDNFWRKVALVRLDLRRSRPLP